LTPEREIGTEDNIIINEVQLILAEKRTSLSTMRTGIAVLVLPLSALSVLIAFSKYYDVMRVIHLLVPLLVIISWFGLSGLIPHNPVDHADSPPRSAYLEIQARTQQDRRVS
jgi:hypothetical protein